MYGVTRSSSVFLCTTSAKRSCLRYAFLCLHRCHAASACATSDANANHQSCLFVPNAMLCYQRQCEALLSWPRTPYPRLLECWLELLPRSTLLDRSWLCLELSILGRAPSMLGLTLELLLCRRLRRVSSGSVGCRPLALANRLRTSVKDTTPESLPLRTAPGF